ncbi:hypothetical protein BX667DRAFT_510581 [Coemansia mojavensis]|nr:hypothetical protein BX667DRAFT_510581 [Coemansia mojavensis]
MASRSCLCEVCDHHLEESLAIRKEARKITFKKLHNMEWYFLNNNDKVIEFIQLYGIDSDDHEIIKEVKRRIIGHTFNPCIILPCEYGNEYWKQGRNWYFLDVPDSLVKACSYPILENKPSSPYITERFRQDIHPTRTDEIIRTGINEKDYIWEVMRMRLCYLYYRWLGIKSYHPHMFESHHCATLLRVCRIRDLDFETRLKSLQRDLENMDEMREDLYKLFMLKGKNMGQKRVLELYWMNAGVYLRQIYMECRLLLLKYHTCECDPKNFKLEIKTTKFLGREYKEYMVNGRCRRCRLLVAIPKDFKWIQTRMCKINPTYIRSTIPEWVSKQPKQATPNRDVPFRKILDGGFDSEAAKIYVKDKYFMNPLKMDEVSNPTREFRRKLRKFVYTKDCEKKVPFSEKIGPDAYYPVFPKVKHPGDYNVGSDLERIYINFRAYKRKPWRTTKRPSYTDKEAEAAFKWEPGETDIIQPHIYKELLKHVKEVDFTKYWYDLHDETSGPREDSMVYYKQMDGTKIYHINPKKASPLFKASRYGKAVSQMEAKYMVSDYMIKHKNMGKLVYSEIMGLLVGDKYEKEYTDHEVNHNIRMMKVIRDLKGGNPSTMYECFNQYMVRTDSLIRNQRRVPPPLRPKLSDEELGFLNEMKNTGNQGIVAAQGITEPLTQTALSSFHFSDLGTPKEVVQAFDRALSGNYDRMEITIDKQVFNPIDSFVINTFSFMKVTKRLTNAEDVAWGRELVEAGVVRTNPYKNSKRIYCLLVDDTFWDKEFLCFYLKRSNSSNEYIISRDQKYIDVPNLSISSNHENILNNIVYNKRRRAIIEPTSFSSVDYISDSPTMTLTIKNVDIMKLKDIPGVLSFKLRNYDDILRTYGVEYLRLEMRKNLREISENKYADELVDRVIRDEEEDEEE